MKFARNQHETAPIVDISDVPRGFVQIADVLPDSDPRKKHWQRVLSDAHAEGRIRAVKLFRSAKDGRTGPVFVDRDEALEYISGYERRMSHNVVDAAAATAPSPAAPPSPAENYRTTHERRIAGLIAENNALLAAIFDLLREQSRRCDQPQWHPNVVDEVEA